MGLNLMENFEIQKARKFEILLLFSGQLPECIPLNVWIQICIKGYLL
jgi:hypothetical protein